MKIYIFFIVIILLLFSCLNEQKESDVDSISNVESEVKPELKSFGDSLFLGFREGMDWSDIQNELEKLIEKNIIRKNLSSQFQYDPYIFILPYHNSNYEFNLNFKTTNSKLTSISIWFYYNKSDEEKKIYKKKKYSDSNDILNLYKRKYKFKTLQIKERPNIITEEDAIKIIQGKNVPERFIHHQYYTDSKNKIIVHTKFYESKKDNNYIEIKYCDSFDFIRYNESILKFRDSIIHVEQLRQKEKQEREERKNNIIDEI